jgi:hypothetical protein
VSTNALLLSIAGEINAAHAQAIQHADTAISFARQAGELLLKVKASLAHGEFLPWVASNCTVSPRQAQRYMAAAQGKRTPLAEKVGNVSNVLIDKVFHLSAIHALPAELLFPDGETLGIRTFYGMSGPSDSSGLFCEYDRRGINAAFCSVRDKAKAHHVPLEKLSVYEGSPTYWDSMHEMDLMDAAKAVQS